MSGAEVSFDVVCSEILEEFESGICSVVRTLEEPVVRTEEEGIIEEVAIELLAEVNITEDAMFVLVRASIVLKNFHRATFQFQGKWTLCFVR